jgi:hypothetical protein
MVIDYLVENAPVSEGKNNSAMMDILLPTFFISVARFEIKIDAMPGA